MTTLKVGEYEVEISRPDKVLFPDDGITKLELAEYYQSVAKKMLALIKDHPLALVRFPDGITGQRFFQKSKQKWFPDWIETVELPKKGGTTEYVVACRPATLIFLANQACIELHPLLAPTKHPTCPDRLIFDFDPSTDDFEPVREGARALKALLDDLKLPSFLMTSGSRGLHVYVPLKGSDDYELVRTFADDVAVWLSKRYEHLTTEFKKADRGDRVFVDSMRNSFGAHAIAPYSPRGKSGAPVATPIPWPELDDPELDAARYSLRSPREGADPWKGWRSKAKTISGAVKTLTTK
jgi:bifunctional non-homologous end joining protein LigD